MAFSSLISRYMHHLLAIGWVFLSSLGSFLGKKLMASLWLWVCGLSSHTFSPHHTSPVMLPSLSNLDPFSNLSCFHLTLLEDVCLMHLINKLWSGRAQRGLPVEISGCCRGTQNRKLIRVLLTASYWEPWPVVRQDDCCGSKYVTIWHSRLKEKIDFSHASHSFFQGGSFPKPSPPNPQQRFPLCLIGQN